MTKKQFHHRVLTWGKIAQRLRVPMGTLLGVVFLWTMHPSRRSLYIGGVIALIGALLRLWAAGYIEKGRVLAQRGPYALTRNPLYFGSFLMALGVIVAGNGYLLLLPFGLFFMVIYYPVMKAEEDDLRQNHGQEFELYSRRVPRFFPRMMVGAGPPSMFLWTRVLKNREHRTFTALMLVVMVLLFKVLYWT